eukprot:183388_1
MGSFAYSIFWQTRIWVSRLKSSNYEQTQAELNELAELYGDDAILFALRSLLEELNLGSATQTNDAPLRLLRATVLHLYESDARRMARLFGQALESLGMSDGFLRQLLNALKLSEGQDVLIAIVLTQSSDSEAKKEGVNYMKSPLFRVSETSQLPVPAVRALLYFLRLRDCPLPAARREALLIQTRAAYSGVEVPASMAPLLGSHPALGKIVSDFKSEGISTLYTRIASSCRPAKVLLDLGYNACASRSALKSVLSEFAPLSASDVAHLIGVVVQTPFGLNQRPGPDGVWLPSGRGVGGSGESSGSSDDGQERKKGGDKEADTWDADVFMAVLKIMCPTLDWADVCRGLDYANFFIPDKAGFTLFTKIHISMPGALPIDQMLFREWKNKDGQFSLIKAALTWIGSWPSTARMQSQLDSAVAPTADHWQPWTSLDLIETLLALARTDLYAAVRRVFKQPLESCPELLLCGVAEVKMEGSHLKDELLAVLMPTFLKPHRLSPAVLDRLWSVDAALVCRWLVKMYGEDRAFLVRITDILRDMSGGKAISTVLKARPHSFAIDLAAQMSRNGAIHMDMWLPTRFAEGQQAFSAAVLERLEENLKLTVEDQKARQKPNYIRPLTSWTLYTQPTILIMFRCLVSPESGLDPTVKAQADGLYKRYRNLVQVDDVEEVANMYFQKVYDGKISLDQMIAAISRFKDSSVSTEQDIYKCMVHNLFDEYRFFCKYPEKELEITGTLFGLLVRHKLVTGLSLGLCLRYTLDSLGQPGDSKLFRFGLWSLEQFIGQIHEWPQYCSLLVQLPDLRKLYPDIVKFIESRLPEDAKEKAAATANASAATSSAAIAIQAATSAAVAIATGKAAVGGKDVAKGGETGEKAEVTKNGPTPSADTSVLSVESVTGGSSASSEAGENGMDKKTASFFNNLDIESILPGVKVAMPEEKIQDQVHTLVNGLSSATVEKAASKLRKSLKPEHFAYFAQYLVVKRVSVEYNFQQMYLDLLNAMKLPALTKIVLESTYANIQSLLQCSTILTSSSDRSLLKNLGSWLGKLTIGKTRPLLAKKLDLKKLIISAFREGRLIVVVPFAAKILECCADSRIYQPPNPWLMALVALLYEIYQMKELKLTLKFEIEVLFTKCLSLKMDEITPSKILIDLSTQRSRLSVPEPADNEEEVTSPTGQINESTSPVRISADIALFSRTPQLKRCVPIAVQRAIREIIAPVVERSAHIASITTREIALKDFALEPSAERMRRAAHHMARALTRQLALVTCQEPLRAAMQNHIRNLLQLYSNEPALIDQAVKQVSSDNLALGCSLIEKAACERAVRGIDDMLANALTLRRNHRQAGLPFPSEHGLALAVGTGRFPAGLPEPLRPRRGGLNEAQLRVYEDFASIPAPGAGAEQGSPIASIESGESDTSRILSRPLLKTPDLPLPVESTGGPTPSPPRITPAATATPAAVSASPDDANLSALSRALRDLSRAVEAVPESAGGQDKLAALPRESEIHARLAAFPTLIRQDYNRSGSEASLLVFARELFQSLYARGHSVLYLDTLLAVLKTLEQHCPQVGVELTRWVLRAEEGPRLDIDVTIGLVRLRLIPVHEIDQLVAKRMVSQEAAHQAAQFFRGTVQQSVQVFALTMVERLVIRERLFRLESFPSIMEALSRMVQSSTSDKESIEPVILNKTKQVLSYTDVRPDEQLGALNFPTPFPHGGELVSAGSSPSSATTAVGGAGFKQVVQRLFEEWQAVASQSSPAREHAMAKFFRILEERKVLEPESMPLFFTELARVSLDQCLQDACIKPMVLSYSAIDSFCSLCTKLVKNIDTAFRRPLFTKIALLHQILQVLCDLLRACHSGQSSKFNQRPLFRMMVILLQDLCTPDPATDAINVQILLSFAECFHSIQPSRLPGFCFSWVELISHRSFMPRMLLIKNKYSVKCRTMYHQLLVDLFRFMEPFLRVAQLTDSVRMLYRGTLRVLLVLLHDFPEFLCEFHFSFCNVIPPSCIQMRNLILSAFPRNMRLPDPFQPNLKVDLLPEIRLSPEILSDTTELLIKTNQLPAGNHGSGVKDDIDNYLRNMDAGTKMPSEVFANIRNKLLLSGARGTKEESNAVVAAPGSGSNPLDTDSTDKASPATAYNVPLINSLVMYLGQIAIEKMHASARGSQSVGEVTKACICVFLQLIMELDEEGRYYYLNAVANQLRYPNNHTHFFSWVLLVLFNDAQEEIIQEQITRVLLERLIVHRPHPWGLLITFIELIKNPRYDFWSHKFTKCAPEIERLFQSVAKSCSMQPDKKPPHLPAEMEMPRAH